MLVLTRKRNEAIVLEDGRVRIRVLEIRGDAVRLGIEAPADVRVVREEVWLAAEENQKATQIPDPDALGAISPLSPPQPKPTAPERSESPVIPKRGNHRGE